MNILLPPLPDREALLGFRVSIAILIGLAVAAVGFLVPLGGPIGWMALGAGTAILLVILGGRRERTVGKFYLLWNRATQEYANRARTVVTSIWYWTVFTVIARTGEGGLELHQSTWRTRETLRPEAYADPGGAPTDREGSGDSRDLVRWAGRVGRPWTLVLIPLFVLLRALETSGRKKSAADIYTLY